MSYNSKNKFASFTCSKLECTVNNKIIDESICVNTSAVQTNCCCYSDGCSSEFLLQIISKNNSLTTPRPSYIPPGNGTVSNTSNITISNILPFTTPKSLSSPLKCIQGLWDTTDSLTLTATSCTDSNAITCFMKYDLFTKLASLSCSTQNCSIYGKNVHSFNGIQQDGCCYGNNCTSIFFSKLPPKASSSGFLKCLQGSMNTTLPLTATPTYCADPYAVTCIKQSDSKSQFATFTCSNSYCIKNYEFTPDPICVNISKSQTNCCCYGNDCTSQFISNVTIKFSNISTTPPAMTFTTSKAPSSSNLKCLQLSINTSFPLTALPTYCKDPQAITCIKHSDSYSQYSSFTCSNSNCSKKGQYTPDPICVNVTIYQTNCCCYGNDCTSQFISNVTIKFSNISTTPPAMTFTTSKAPSSSNLKCLQLSMNTSFPLTALPTYCKDPQAITCIKHSDSYSQYSSFTCSNSNCSINGIFTPDPICVIVSKSQTNCCCYGDDCTSKFISNLTSNPLSISSTSSAMTFTTSMSTPVFWVNVTGGSSFNLTTYPAMTFTTPKAPSSSTLKCLQGLMNTTLPLTAIPTYCIDPYSVTCRTQHDTFNKVATFSCGNSNCSINGQLISTSICINITTFQTNCCCYGDGCNSVGFSSNLLTYSSSNTNKTTPVAAKNNLTDCDESGFKILSNAADPSSVKGKFAGYLSFRSSCQQLCDKSYGLIKCFGYIFEQNNHGKCTIFQQPIFEKIIESPGSNVIVSQKC